MATGERLRCIVCKRDFFDHIQAANTACKQGGNHIIQEIIDGSRNPDTGESADFRSVDEADLKRWGEEARKIFRD